MAIGAADLAADANYEMILAVLPLFLTAGIGAPVYAVGLVEGVADGLAAAVKVISGRVSDRIRQRHAVGVAGYAFTTLGFAGLVAVTAWPQVLANVIAGRRPLERIGFDSRRKRTLGAGKHRAAR